MGGGLTPVGTREARRVARWDGTSWSPLGDGMGATVLALAYGDGVVYASTASDAADGVARQILGRWDGTQWTDLATVERGLPPPSSDGVRSASYQFYHLRVVGRHPIAAGSVPTSTGGKRVLVYDGERLAPLGGGVGAISTQSLAFTRDAVWVGGILATTGHGDTLAPSHGIARFRLGAGP